MDRRQFLMIVPATPLAALVPPSPPPTPESERAAAHRAYFEAFWNNCVRGEDKPDV